MEFLVELWLPIVVSGVAVFMMSALNWTALPTHKTEFSGFSNDEAVGAALRSGAGAPGRYVTPNIMGGAGNTPEGKAKLERGPLAYVTIAPPGAPNMGKMMGLSLLSAILISAFVAYIASNAVAADASYLHVFRITGTVTFMAYALGTISESIWFARPWKSQLLNAFDALLYAGITGGVFGWLWS
ncbi:MAG: hypothetical protein ACKVS7_14415 [Gemmatimonadaceae bacterium]